MDVRIYNMKRIFLSFLMILFFLCGCRAETQTGNEVNSAGQSFSSADMVAFKCRFVSEDNYTGEEGIGSAEYYFELKVLDDGRIEGKAQRNANDEDPSYDLVFASDRQTLSALQELTEEIGLKDLDGISHIENGAPEGKGISLRIRYASAKIVSCEDNTKNHLSLRQMLAVRDWFEQVSGAGRIRRHPVEDISPETFAEETGLDPDLSSVTDKDIVFTRIRENRTVIYKISFTTHEGNAYELYFSADTDDLCPEDNGWDTVYPFEDFTVSLNGSGQGLCEWKTDAYAYALYMPENAEEGYLEYMRIALKGILWNSSAGSGS